MVVSEEPIGCPPVSMSKIFATPAPLLLLNDRKHMKVIKSGWAIRTTNKTADTFPLNSDNAERSRREPGNRHISATH
jgi:hypothetical protein